MARLERQRQPKSGLTEQVIAYLAEKAKSVSLPDATSLGIAGLAAAGTGPGANMSNHLASLAHP